MKSADNHFRGFPGLWNIAALYLFLLHLSAVLSTFAMAVLVVLTFVPFHVLHPVRVVRLRWLTLSLIGVWTALVMVALINDFEVGVVVKAVLCLIALYIVGCDSAIRLVRSLNA